jgi:glycosyltransferase involved in cell wall biosynthesis
MKRVKLLVDGHCFDDLYQSASVYLKGLYDQLKDDEEIELFIAAYDTAHLQSVFNGSERITYVKLQSKSKYYRLLFDFPRIIEKYGIDVAHYQYISPFVKRSKEIVTIHDILYKDFDKYFPLPYKLRNDLFFKRSAKRADLVTSVSEYSVEAIVRHFKIPASKIKLVPNGIANIFFANPSPGVNVRQKYYLKEYILCVSRIEPRKNHLFLVKAYCELELWNKNIQLVLLGRQDLEVKELDEYVDSLNPAVRKNIVRFENISFSELIGFYTQSLVVVYPSLGEGFGIPPLEAAALKTKVLCSNTTAMADFSFFKDSLFDPSDLETFKRKLLEQLSRSDEENRDRISGEIRNRYNWASIAKEFAITIKELFAVGVPAIGHDSL